MDHDADLVIAGAGVAGLSAALRVLDAPLPVRRIVVVDAQPGVADDRTWCSWTTPDRFRHLVDGSWETVGVAFADGARRLPLLRHRYSRIRQRDFDEHAWTRLAADPRVVVLQAQVESVDDRPSGAVVRTSRGTLHAGMAWQSVLDPAPRRRTPLLQHFAGAEVVTAHPVFDPSSATLMDFTVDQDAGASFLYVLPAAEDRALVEHTVLSPSPRSREWHLDRVHDHLARIGAGDVEVVRTEGGAIPLRPAPAPTRTGRHVWHLGAVAGDTKSSTGYAFGRIQRRVDALVEGWVLDGVPGELRPVPTRFRWADELLLSVARHRPDRVPDLFRSLFDTVPVDDLLDFLDERTTPSLEWRVLRQVDWRPFAAGMTAGLAGSR